MVSVSEIFVSVQGEGLTLGKPALFIRTGKCSVKCKFCDTPYSWKVKRQETVKGIVEIVKKEKLPTTVITGGEPLEEESLPKLIYHIQQLPFVKEIILETCGAFFRENLPEEKLRPVISPKPPSMKKKFPIENVLKLIKTYKNCELKVGVLTQEDLTFAKNLIASAVPYLNYPPVIQPIDIPYKNYKEVVKEVIKIVLKDKELLKVDVRIIPQVHKLVGIK